VSTCGPSNRGWSDQESKTLIVKLMVKYRFCWSSKKTHVRTAATQDPCRRLAPGSRLSRRARQQRQPFSTLPLNGDLVCWWWEGQGPKERRRFSRVVDQKAPAEGGAGILEGMRQPSDADPTSLRLVLEPTDAAPPRLRLVLEVRPTSHMRCVGSRLGVRAG